MITIKEIARRANVSIGTVDRVLHNRGRVAEGTARFIKQIVNETGYLPNLNARSLSLKRQILIAGLMPLPNQDDGYWKKPKTGILNAGKELAPYNVEIKLFHYNKYDESSFRERFEQMLLSKPDGIIMAPVISDTADSLLREIPADTPYLFFDGNLGKSNSICYIGQNSFDSGVLAGELMKMIIQIPGVIAAIQPLANDYHIVQRIEGFCQSITSSGKYQLSIHIPEKGGDAASFRKILRQVFAENDQINGLFVSNAACHYAADYLLEKKLTEVKLIGYDLVKKNVKYLQNGVIDFLICQRPEKQGFDGVHILHRYLTSGEITDPQIFMPLDIITKMNVNYYQYV
jgi:LacI family transcriptional regulator